MELFNKQTDSMQRSAIKARNLRIITTCGLILLVFAIAGLVSYLEMRPIKAPELKSSTVARVQASSIEVTYLNGTVLIQRAGSTDWKPARVGILLVEGDAVQTDNSSEASVRYPDGTVLNIQPKTMFIVQSFKNGAKPINAPLVQAVPEKQELNIAEKPGGEADGKQPAEKKAGEELPTMVLQQLTPFGRSLELIGQVEAGSNLFVNGEPVEIAGDGTFKHFTNPFPPSSRRVRLAFKVTNLAGKSRILSTSYDFGPHSGEN